MLFRSLALSGYLNKGNHVFCRDAEGVVCTAEKSTGVVSAANKAKFEEFDSSVTTKGIISGAGLGLGVIGAAAAGYFFYAESQKPAEAAAVLYRGMETQPAQAQVVLPPRLDAGPVRFLAQ